MGRECDTLLIKPSPSCQHIVRALCKPMSIQALIACFAAPAHMQPYAMDHLWGLHRLSEFSLLSPSINSVCVCVRMRAVLFLAHLAPFELTCAIRTKNIYRGKEGTRDECEWQI